MTTHRLIFRIDYPVNFEIIDKPGRLLELLRDNDSQFWAQLNDAVTDRAVVATSNSTSENGNVEEYRNITVGPTSLVISIESCSGFGSSRILDDDACLRAIKSAQAVVEQFKIVDIKRAGLRSWQYAKIDDQSGLNFFREHINKIVLQSTERSFEGEIQDIMLSFDGKIASNAGFHARFGPFSNDELHSKRDYFEKIGKAFGASSSYSCVFDVDVFETDFSIQGRRLASWIKHHAAPASVLSRSILDKKGVQTNVHG